MTYKNKKEVIVNIIKNLNEPTKFGDVADMFEERTSMSVSIQRIHQVAKNMADEEIAKIKKREENGNLVNYVWPKP